MKNGDRVKDKFKLPKPGAECVTGTLQGDPVDGDVTVKWDDGTTRVTNTMTLEVIDDDK